MGEHVIRGLAWSGEGAITRIEVSVDAGTTWQDAHIEFSPGSLAVETMVVPVAGRAVGQYTIMARATDERGCVQPQTQRNFLRKHFDGIVPVHVSVE